MNVAVLGSGIIGLWTALLLAKEGVSVRVFSRDEIGSTTSASAASVLTPFLPWEPDSDLFKTQTAWAHDTVAYMSTLPIFSQACTLIECFECGSNNLLEDDFHVRKLDFLTFSAFRRVDFGEEISGADFAIQYQCYMCLPNIFLPWLVQECTKYGVTFERRTFNNISEIMSLEQSVVFNCLGHSNIFADIQRYAVFGQSIHVPSKENGHQYFGVGLGDHAVFVQPNGFYIGSYFVYDRDDLKVDPSLIAESTRFVKETFPRLCQRLDLPIPSIDLTGSNVIRTGMRPFRRVGPRLEIERFGSKTFVHHYGHGAHGWTLGYASARKVVDDWLVFQNACEHGSVSSAHTIWPHQPSHHTPSVADSSNFAGLAGAGVIRRAHDASELRRCASMMAAADPWRFFGYDFEKCLHALDRKQVDVYVYQVNEGSLMGFIAVRAEGLGDEPLIDFVCVDERLRGKGIGTNLIDFVETQLFALASNIYLFVSDVNPNAVRLYQRLGYNRVGVLPDFVQLGQTEYLYRKTRGPRFIQK